MQANSTPINVSTATSYIAVLANQSTADIASNASLLQQLRPKVLAYCMRYLKHPEDAEEACQDTMVNAISGLAKFQNRASLQTWLMKIAYHVCSAYYRAKRNQDLLFESFDEHSCNTLDDAIEIDSPDLSEAIQSLSELQKQVLRYRFVNDLSLNEIAIVLGCSLSAIKMNYYRAIQKIQALYQSKPQSQ